MSLANLEAFGGELELRALGEVERFSGIVCDVDAARADEDGGLPPGLGRAV